MKSKSNKMNEVELDMLLDDALMGFAQLSTSKLQHLLERRIKMTIQNKKSVLAHLDDHWNEELVEVLENLNKSIAETSALVTQTRLCLALN